jgi:hypothetical protein
MYKIKRNTIEYLRVTDEFLECASEDIKKKRCTNTYLFSSKLSKLMEILKYQRSGFITDLWSDTPDGYGMEKILKLLIILKIL